ncbi:hypothetical protein PG990_007358 [Apiospora arundinis]
MAEGLGYVHEDAFDEGFLQVDSIHNLYYAQYGARDGKPVIFLHGGPGGGTSKGNTGFFNPAIYRVVLLDQRGAGKSTPIAELRDNTTQHLIADIETLREHLGIPKPTRPWSARSSCGGIFLGSREEGAWADAASAAFYPQGHKQFLEFLPAEMRSNPEKSYHKLVTTGETPARIAAARAWNTREMSMSTVKPSPEVQAMLASDSWVMSHASLELHYFANSCFLEPFQFLQPENIAKISHIPTSLVQGRIDLLCPPKWAYMLHEALPQSKLYIMDGAGHSANEPPTFKQLKAVCDEYANLA